MQEWWICLLPLPLFGYESRKYTYCGFSGLVISWLRGVNNFDPEQSPVCVLERVLVQY
jgi:hypothetical protein